MRIDVFSIFPGYFDALDLSLAGKARDSGCSSSPSTTSAAWTHDRHRTVDDTPYGGGAGMVMKPEPWGEALDSLDRSARAARCSSCPTPAGERFTQAVARDLAAREHLVFSLREIRGDRPAGGRRARPRGSRCASCRWATTCSTAARWPRWPSARPSSGCCRVHGQRGLPRRGVARGRPARGARLHQARLLARPRRPAGPAQRRPRRDRPVAPRPVRPAYGDPSPDLLSPSVLREDVVVRRVEPGDAGELFTLQRACWLQEEQANPGVPIPALAESLDDVRGWLTEGTVLVARSAGRLVGAVRAVLRDGKWHVGRLMVRRTSRAADWVGRSWRRSRRRRRPRRRRTSSSPVREASATSGCTRRPGTGSPAAPARGRLDGEASLDFETARFPGDG